MRGLLEPPAGDPNALATAVDGYEATERAIAGAVDELARITMTGAGISIEALGEAAARAGDHLVTAQARYRGTSLALREYTVALVTFHAVAAIAVEQEHSARRAAGDAHVDLTDAARYVRSAAMNPNDQASIDYWQSQVYLARGRCDVAESAMNLARADYARAADERDRAAERAMGLIDASFEDTNDSVGDQARHVIDMTIAPYVALASWAVHFLGAILDKVLAAVVMVVAGVLLSLAAVVMVAMLVRKITLTVQTLVMVTASVLASLTAMLVLARMAYTAGTLLGVDDLTHIRMVLGALMIACPVISYFVLSRVMDEVSKPSPTVSVLRDEDVTTASAARALESLEASAPDSLDDLLAQAGAVDALGGEERTVVDIAKIVAEDGTVSWIVTLPSTQDWVVPGDEGATNDLDADLLLLAFPHLASQYEKAVLAAMEQAGVGRGEAVLVTGWSLGGILAGHLADTKAGGYRYAGVVVAGAPIDHMDIASDIPVVQVKHSLDEVHRADLIDSVPDQGLHVSLWDGKRSGIGMDDKVDLTGGHNARLYRQTLATHVEANPGLNDPFRDFLVIDDPASPGVPTIEHRQFAFHE